jgi:hypothetical protein
MNSALRRRIAPSVPLTLQLKDDGGASFTREFRLSFDFNVCATIEEKTGVNVLDASDFLPKLTSPKVISTAFWAALLPHHADYDSDEGLIVIRSYMGEDNLKQISDALWEAYLLYCPEKKREALKKLAEQGAKEQENPTPLTPTNEPNPSPGSSSGPLPQATSDSATNSSAA